MGVSGRSAASKQNKAVRLRGEGHGLEVRQPARVAVPQFGNARGEGLWKDSAGISWRVAYRLRPAVLPAGRHCTIGPARSNSANLK